MNQLDALTPPDSSICSVDDTLQADVLDDYHKYFRVLSDVRDAFTDLLVSHIADNRTQIALAKEWHSILKLGA